MCCQGRRGFGMGRHSSGCRCGCMSFHRSFISAKEELEMLNEYKDQLKKEVEGIDEHLEKLRKK